MKSFKITLCFLLLNMVVYSQITIDQNDMPDVDDTIRTSTAYYTGVDYTLTGPGYSWDFSGLIPVMQQVDTFVSVLSTPFVYNLVFVYPLVATIARERPDNNSIPGYQLTNIFDFYKETPTYFALAGYGAKLNGIPIPVKYNNPDYLYHFPVTYGSVDSSNSAFAQSVPGIGFFGETKKRLNHVDGWGSLTTPYGTFQTIRIKSEIETFDTVYMDSLGFGIGIPRFTTEYKWLADGFGLPLLTVSVSGLTTTIIYIDSARKVLIGTEELTTADNAYRVYPNPAGEVVHLEFKDKYHMLRAERIEVIDLNGRIWKNLPVELSENSCIINVKNLPDGVYMIIIKKEDSMIIRKFNVIK